MTGAQDCHDGAFEMGSNALLEEIEEVDEGEAILSRRQVAALRADPSGPLLDILRIVPIHDRKSL